MVVDRSMVPGLTETDAAARLERDGPNVLPVPPGPSILGRIGHQLASPLILALIVAGLVTVVVLDELIEGFAILAIVLLNVVIETRQELKSDAAIRALSDLTAPTARVRRGGMSMVVPANDVVVGDRLELEAGDRVAADAVLEEATELATDEASLTGESLPVGKRVVGPGRPGDLPGERPGEVFAGTLAVRGSGSAIVSATGGATELGKVATGLGDPTEPPLVAELRRVAAQVGVLAAVLGTALGVFAYLRSRGEPDAFSESVLAGVAMAIAAVPEGLSSVVLTALAFGAQRMARRGAIVRHLAAIEAIGSATVLCTDKTGTITTGRLTVVEAHSAGDDVTRLWLAARRCNDARDGVGDPLDVALLAAADGAGVAGARGEQRIDARPFSADTRSMTTVHRLGDGTLRTTMKGAPEVVFARCAPSELQEAFAALVDDAAARGLRVLALAEGVGDDMDSDPLVLVGLVALGDPVRETAPTTIDALHRAGIRVVMVTGDHAVTARSIASTAGLRDGDVVVGADLAEVDAEGRNELLRSAVVVARVDPTIKRDLVDAHRAHGHVVAMTGDGVNDAPALQRADVGIAVAGEGGTDVAREAADLVITDGDLGTIAAAVSEGRRIYRNLVNSVVYLLSGNLSEAVVVLGSLATIPELAVPLLPVQLLWLNLVTDGLPAIALGVDEPATDPLEDAPRPFGARLLGRPQLMMIGIVGLVVGVTVLVAAHVARAADWEPLQVRSVMLLTLLMVHLMLPYIVRARRTTFERGWTGSRQLLWSVGGSMTLQALMFVLPVGRSILGLAALPPVAWLFPLVGTAVVIGVIDGGRAVLRRRGATGHRTLATG